MFAHMHTHVGSVEEMLVSAVMPIMSIYRLPLGQYGYTGHVINLPQDVVSFAHSKAGGAGPVGQAKTGPLFSI